MNVAFLHSWVEYKLPFIYSILFNMCKGLSLNLTVLLHICAKKVSGEKEVSKKQYLTKWNCWNVHHSQKSGALIVSPYEKEKVKVAQMLIIEGKKWAYGRGTLFYRQPCMTPDWLDWNEQIFDEALSKNNCIDFQAHQREYFSIFYNF